MTQIAAGFFPARFSTAVPSVRGMTQVASPTFLKGYPVVATAGLIDECGADPIAIAGIALSDYQTTPGWQAANSPATITGRFNGVSVALAVSTTEFSGRLVNGDNTTIAPTAADLEQQYGITKYASGWAVDKSKIGGDARVVITSIDTNLNLVWFKVLPAYQQG